MIGAKSKQMILPQDPHTVVHMQIPPTVGGPVPMCMLTIYVLYALMPKIMRM